MHDLISRQKAIDELKRISFSHWFECGEYLSEDAREIEIISSSKALKAIETLPPAQPEPHWIPVSERLPEHWKSVLVCFKAGRKCPHNQIQVGHFGPHEVEDEWFEKIGNVTVLYTDKYYYPLDNVIAWMPLPEPYKEDNNG